jgi:anti-sigma-K factor RskA
MTCQEFEELSGAYALDAITPEERVLAEEHLAQCLHCTQLLQDLQLAVDALPLSVPIVEPSPALKDRILASVQVNETMSPLPIQRQRPLIARRRRVLNIWSKQFLAVAAVILFILLSAMTIWNISLQQQISSLSASVATVSYPIRGTTTEPGTAGELTCFPRQQVCMLVMHGLPSLEGTQVYQGWLLQGKQPTSIGLLNVQNGVASVDFQGNASVYTAVAVSVEPGPAASPDAPRGQILALGPVGKSATNT